MTVQLTKKTMQAIKVNTLVPLLLGSAPKSSRRSTQFSLPLADAICWFFKQQKRMCKMLASLYPEFNALQKHTKNVKSGAQDFTNQSCPPIVV